MIQIPRGCTEQDEQLPIGNGLLIVLCVSTCVRQQNRGVSIEIAPNQG
jgi:hypothetical protein